MNSKTCRTCSLTEHPIYGHAVTELLASAERQGESASATAGLLRDLVAGFGQSPDLAPSSESLLRHRTGWCVTLRSEGNERAHSERSTDLVKIHTNRRIVGFDIETIPGFTEPIPFFGLGDVKYQTRYRPDQVASWPRMLTVAWEDLDGTKDGFLASWQFETYKEFVAAIAAELNSWDVSVGHNINGFDLPWVGGQCMEFGVAWQTHQSYDTLSLLRGRTRFESLKLEALTERLLGAGDSKNDGGKYRMDVALKASEGDKPCQAEIERYNRNDTRTTNLLLRRIAPWVQLPFAVSDSLHLPTCAHCGHAELTEVKAARTAVMSYRQWQCDSCGGFTKARTGGTRVSNYAAV